jgi:hypothetical protein
LRGDAVASTDFTIVIGFFAAFFPSHRSIRVGSLAIGTLVLLLSYQKVGS